MEIFKDIKGYEGIYQVSNKGNIKSLYIRKGITSALRVLHIGTHGYLGLTLSKNGVQKNFKVHRLVALEFLPKMQGLTEINHIDGNKLNNDINNLEWSNRSKNMKHAFDKGLAKISDNQKKGMSNRRKGKPSYCKKVTNIITGETYISAREAADDIGMKHNTLLAKLRGVNPNETNLRFL